MSKGAYYAGMATAPQVKPADFSTPIVNMLQKLDERLIQQQKEKLAEQKANEKFSLSQQEKLQDVINSSSFKGFGLNSLDQSASEFTKHLGENFEQANMLFSQGLMTKSELSSFNAGLISSARRMQNIAGDVRSFMEMDERLAAQGQDSHWNDLVGSMIADLDKNLALRTNSKGDISLVTIGEDEVERSIPASQILDFLTARRKTDIPGMISDIAKNTEGYTFETEKSSVTRYLDYSKNPNGELTEAQNNILYKQLINLDPRDVYDASVRAGIIGDNENQIQIITDFSNENVITPDNLTAMRQALYQVSKQQLEDELRNKNTSKPRTPRGGSGTNNTYAIYDDETGKYSYRRNSQTAFSMKSGFSGKDMINGRPTGSNKDVPPGTNITDIRLTPFGLEVWGTQIKDKEGKILFTRDAASLSAEEVSSMGGTRVNFHKVIDPNSNESAIGELQRIFGFPIDKYKEQLELNTQTDPETGTTVVSLDDPNDRY